jgi:hypothetical protein
MKETELSSLITSFTVQIVQVIEQATEARIRTALSGAFGPAKRGPGRPPKNALLPAAPIAKAVKRKGPKQLCPVPGCKNPAAPVFGMVCKNHKDVPKGKIKEYRAKRKAAKAKK